MSQLLLQEKTIDCIIVGQGLAGIWFSYFLQQAGKTFHIIDKYDPHSASLVSSGILNPLTGKRFVKSWLADELTAFALEHYAAMESLLQAKIFYQKSLDKYFPNAESENYFDNKVGHQAFDIQVAKLEKNELRDDVLNNVRGGVKIEPVWQLDCALLVKSYRKILAQQQLITDEYFDYNELQFTAEDVQYKNLKAKYIVFCEGHLAKKNPWFNYLPLVPNKGEVLLVRIPGFPRQQIVKHDVFIVPVENDLFWVGSNYQLEFENDAPDENEKTLLTERLKKALKTDFEMVSHSSGIRPTVIDRRPLLGKHPQHESLVIFNGLGTKAVSLAPYFAKQLVTHLFDGKPLHEEADIKRFA